MSDGDLFDALRPAVAGLEVELVDVEVRARLVRVTIDRAGGVDLDTITAVTRAVSGVLDRYDPVPGRYTLEVSSPGVERPLRTPQHFARAVGETVSVRTVAGGEGERRVVGQLVAADTDGFVLEGDTVPGGRRRISYGEVDRARTVFDWGGAPRPAGGRRHGSARRRSARPAAGDAREKVTTSS